MAPSGNNIFKDLAVIALSILVAVMLVKTGALEGFLNSAKEVRFLGSFFAGIFFVSVFTVAPAAVILFELMEANSLWEVAFFGALGALLGDILIFKFIKDRMSEDLKHLLASPPSKKFKAIFRLKFFRLLWPFLGAVIVASPFPDEIGLALMGFSGTDTKIFVPLSFALNFAGIMAVGLISKAL